MIIIRLTCGVLVQFWCSYSTVPLNVIVTLCKRVKERSKTLRPLATRSTCSLESTIDEGDEEITVASGTLSQSSSTGTLNHMDDDNQDSSPLPQQELSLRMPEYLSDTMRHVPTNHDIKEDEESKVQTLEDLFQKT
uniref:MLO-like protein 4 n=1 Tax=Tanacetum cinerariifolium TaxID=118510 RepID=A0A699KAH4_TANCI|nr:MLO-like protein 4 [Tanacetum cinerariifolium]